MDVGLVGQVHQVVDHQAIVAVDAIIAAVEGPARIGAWPEVRDQAGRPCPPRRSRSRRIGGARRPDRSARTDRATGSLLHRHLDAAAVAVDQQAVVAATNIVAFLDPHRQRQQPVGTGVAHGDDRAVEAAVEHHRLAADRSRQWRAVDLVIPARDIPLLIGQVVVTVASCGFLILCMRNTTPNNDAPFPGNPGSRRQALKGRPSRRRGGGGGGGGWGGCRGSC